MRKIVDYSMLQYLQLIDGKVEDDADPGQCCPVEAPVLMESPLSEKQSPELKHASPVLQQVDVLAVGIHDW